MFWKCSVCAEKDKRINDLRDEIKSLRTLVYPSQDSKNVSLVELEQDKILSGSSDPIPVSEIDFEQEAASIITGAYDQSSQVEIE